MARPVIVASARSSGMRRLRRMSWKNSTTDQSVATKLSIARHPEPGPSAMPSAMSATHSGLSDAWSVLADVEDRPCPAADASRTQVDERVVGEVVPHCRPHERHRGIGARRETDAFDPVTGPFSVGTTGSLPVSPSSRAASRAASAGRACPSSHFRTRIRCASFPAHAMYRVSSSRASAGRRRQGGSTAPRAAHEGRPLRPPRDNATTRTGGVEVLDRE